MSKKYQAKYLKKNKLIKKLPKYNFLGIIIIKWKHWLHLHTNISLFELTHTTRESLAYEKKNKIKNYIFIS